MAPSGRTELLNLVEEQDVDGLYETIKAFTSKNKRDCLVSETISEFSKKQLEELWDGMHGICINTFLNSEEPDAQNQEQDKMGKVIQSTTAIAMATLACLKPDKRKAKQLNSVAVPSSLLETAIVLHGILQSLSSDQEHLKNKIASLFEEWWHSNFVGKQELMSQTILYLLAKSTQASASQNDIARVWAVHEILSDVCLNSDSGSTLASYLIQCVHHPQYMTTSQGIMFLGFLFTLNTELTTKLHTAVKNYLHAAPRSWHTKYGEIYFRAWQKSSGEILENIEVNCIQDMMYRAVHASRHHPQSVAAPLFEVLSYIHKQKIQRGVEAMLTRLYEPILWRSLKVTNSDVRFNAVSLLFDVFPLQNPTMDHEHADMALQKQFDIMHGLLTDPVQEIRVTSILGVGTVLNLYWELIPSQVIQCLMTVLVQDLAHDSTSARVREAVIKVFFKLCDNHLCIPVLMKVLPEFQNFIHDTSEIVRTALCDLLIKVKSLRPIKFWNIVPVEHLLARLEGDSPVIVRRIMKLIYSSFVPISASPAEQIERCIFLITQNREAARQFFMNVTNNLGVESSVKYIIVLCKYVLESSRQIREKGEYSGRSHLSDQVDHAENEEREAVPIAVKRKKKGRKEKKKKSPTLSHSPEVSNSVTEDQENKSSNHSNADGSTSLSMEMFSGIVEAIYLMYISLVPQLGSVEHEPLKEGLVKKLSVTVRELINKFEDAGLRVALISLAGHLPSRYLPLISSNLLKSFEEEKSFVEKHNGETATTIKYLIQSGKTGELIEMLKNGIDQVLKIEPNASVDERKNKKAKKGVAFAVEKSCIDFSKALFIVTHLLSQAECRQIIRNNKKHMIHLTESLMAVLQRLDLSLTPHQSLTFTEPLNRNNLTQTFTVCLRCVAFMNAHPSEDAESGSSLVDSVLTWAFKLGPYLQNCEEGKDKCDFAVQLMECIMRMCQGLLLVGNVDDGQLQQVFRLCESTLKSTQPPLSLTLSVLSNVYQFTQLSVEANEGDEQSDTICPQQFAIVCFKQALEMFLAMKKSEGDKTKLKKFVTAVSPVITELIWAVTDNSRPDALAEMWCEYTVSYIVEEMKYHSERGLIESELEKGSSMSEPLISAFRTKEKYKRMMVDDLTTKLESVSDIHNLDGLVTVMPLIQANDTEPMHLALQEAAQKALQKMMPKEMDEDIFRDLKTQIERKIQAYGMTAEERRVQASEL